IGYIVQRKTIAGSCGGLGSVGIDKACDCDDPCESRQKRMAKAEAKRQMLEENRII
ncbi:MAG: (Na+)-NQR maturation NqrM, partial [Oceanisphaera sp.]